MLSTEIKLANLSKRSCHAKIALERRKCDEILTKCHFPAAYKLVSSLWAVQCKHLNNRKLDWRETAARNKAFYIFSLIQLHPPGKLGVHSCVVNKIAKWQHDRMIETLIERLKRGEWRGRGKQRRCKPHFFWKAPALWIHLCAQKTELCCSGRTCSEKVFNPSPTNHNMDNFTHKTIFCSPFIRALSLSNKKSSQNRAVLQTTVSSLCRFEVFRLGRSCEIGVLWILVHVFWLWGCLRCICYCFSKGLPHKPY